jgi:hypothetical protein
MDLPLLYKIFIALIFVAIGWGYSQGVIQIDFKRYQQQVTQIKEMVLDKLFPEERKIALPAIPKIKRNAKSTANFASPPPPPKKVKKVESNEGAKEQLKRKRQDDFHFVHELYQAVMENKPTAVELNQWMNVLDQGGSREGFYRALVLSDKYAGLENFDPTSADQLVIFCKEYMGTYLDQQVQDKQLSSVNSYSIKRIAVEQSLELIDTFYAENANGDKLPRWYAILSADLAAKYPSLWEIKLRSSTNPRIHLKWAQSAPEQQLKSEVIIKLHRVFNHLDGK